MHSEPVALLPSPADTCEVANQVATESKKTLDMFAAVRRIRQQDVVLGDLGGKNGLNAS